MSNYESFGLTSLFTEVDTMSKDTASNIFSAGKAGEGDALLEHGEQGSRRVGRTHVKRRREALFPGMDMRRALARPVKVYFTSDNCMSDVEAGTYTIAILARVGLSTEDDAVMVGFIKAMCLCMAVNSSSVLVPGRSKMYVAGSEFDFFQDVMVVLGNDARRYFRAYADITRDYLKDLIEAHRKGPASDSEQDLADYEEIVDMYEAVKRTAEKRGLLRVMYMVHDSAEFCSSKTSVERMYLMQSKETIFATGAYNINPVDNPVVNKPRASKPSGPVLSSAGMDGMPDGY